MVVLLEKNGLFGALWQGPHPEEACTGTPWRVCVAFVAFAEGKTGGTSDGWESKETLRR